MNTVIQIQFGFLFDMAVCSEIFEHVNGYEIRSFHVVYSR